MCNTYHIKHSFSMPYYPQGNVKAKATNNMIIKILNKIVKYDHHNWYECILYALWIYHTSIHMPMDATLFYLIYGIEVNMPLELEIPSLHVSLK